MDLLPTQPNPIFDVGGIFIGISPSERDSTHSDLWSRALDASPKILTNNKPEGMATWFHNGLEEEETNRICHSPLIFVDLPYTLLQ